MPLSTAQPILEMQIYNALDMAGQTIAVGAEDGATPTSINGQLAKDLANAIHFYTTQAQVVTSVVTVVGGIAVPIIMGTAAPVVAAGGGSGNGVLL